MTETELVTAKAYILKWLHQEGYSAEKRDQQSQDGHWLVYCFTEADGSNCVRCLKPMIETAKKTLKEQCGWSSLHFAALEYMATKATQ